jgi:hypothetical protein
MTSLTAQMEALEKQQIILAKKIKEEEERNLKLNKEASIDRLQALIEPITQNLNMGAGVFRGGNRRGLRREEITRRDIFDEERKKFKLQGKNAPNIGSHPGINILRNEEIFVTLMGIIKKQDERIAKLETIIQSKNNEDKYDGESWNYA